MLKTTGRFDGLLKKDEIVAKQSAYHRAAPSTEIALFAKALGAAGFTDAS